MKYNPKAILIKGLLMRCDYSASAGLTVEYVNDFLIEKLRDDEEMAKENSEASWNSMQIFCKEHTNENIIITA